MTHQNSLRHLELLSKSCTNYEELLDRLVKSEKSHVKIIFDFGKYQRIIEGQKDLEEAIQHNGKSVLIRFLLQNDAGNTNYLNDYKIGDGNMRKVPKEESKILLQSTSKGDSASYDGTLCGKSFGAPSSRYSDQINRAPRRYKFLKKLGEGTLGTVYMAVGNNGLNFAVKVVKKKGHFLPQEADIKFLKQLQHKRIVEYMYTIEPENSNEIHILMEYMHMGSLRDYIDIQGPLDDELLKCFTKQIAEGLDFLHSNGIIHQDLKPENLLLKCSSKLRMIKIADFGSSTFRSYQQKRGQQGRTPKYTAPEVTNSKVIPGRRSDIWSFGVIVIEMMSKEFPWNVEGAHFLEVAEIIETVPPRIIRNDDTDERMVELALLMISPLNMRPYAHDILKFPVLEDPPPQLEEDPFYEDDDEYY
ncbi:unnamed protein product [Caenorhabditis bovis]|uniref:non-specific serine/threonine protein kinase n=1 Tax=Caenorhabditis bovis TaxID=2654633 RepID=A0A8S1FAV2_9PELO|nr:unnamed protein product [Caenorhabditis bovis]